MRSISPNSSNQSPYIKSKIKPTNRKVRLISPIAMHPLSPEPIIDKASTLFDKIAERPLSPNIKQRNLHEVR